MDLSNPLASLMPAADSGALRILARTGASLSGRRIAELAGGNHTSTLRALRRLVAQGIVLTEEAGRANLYRLNRSHVLVPAVLEIVGASTAVLRTLTERIESWRVPCLHAVLYGSMARGEAGPASDIDVLLVRPESLSDGDASRWDDQLAGTEDALYELTGNRLSWLDTTLGDLRRAQQAEEPIFQSWRDDSVLLVGAPLGRLLRDDRATIA